MTIRSIRRSRFSAAGRQGWLVDGGLARSLGVAALLASVVCAGSAQAQTLDWDPAALGGAGTYGSGAWDTVSSLWSNGSADTTWTDGSAAVFAGTNSGSTATINLGAARTAASVAFNTSGYDLTGSALTLTSTTTSLTVASGVSAEIDNPLLFSASTFSLASGSTLTMTGGATANGNVNWVFNGGGTVDLKSGTYVASGGAGLTFWAQTNAQMEAATMTLAGGRLLIGYAGNSTFTINSPSAVITQTTTTNSTIAGRAGNSGTIDLKQGSVTLDSNVVLGNDSGSKGTLTIEGGTFTEGSASTLFINSGATSATGAGTLNLTGGTYTVPAISFGNTGNTYTAGATGTMNVSGGALYLGTGGIVTAGAGLTTAINLSGGTIGATGAWTTAMGMTLTNTNGGVTFQAANASNTAENITLSGQLTGAGTLTKTGAGTLTLSNGSNNYSGGNVVDAGTLIQGIAGALGSSNGALTLGGGTVNANAITTTLGVLNLTAASSLDFGTPGTATSIDFADSSAESWTGLLNVLDYDDNSTAADHLVFGATGTGITNAELADIRFVNPVGLPAGTYTAVRGTNGEVDIVGTGTAATPEPVSLALLTLGGLGASGLRRRRAS